MIDIENCSLLPMFSKMQRRGMLWLIQDCLGEIDLQKCESRKNGTASIAVKTHIGDEIRVSIRLRRPVIKLSYQTPYLVLHDGIKLKWVDPRQIIPRQWGYTTANFRLYRVEEDYLDIEDLLRKHEKLRLETMKSKTGELV